MAKPATGRVWVEAHTRGAGPRRVHSKPTGGRCAGVGAAPLFASGQHHARSMVSSSRRAPKNRTGPQLHSRIRVWAMLWRPGWVRRSPQVGLRVQLEVIHVVRRTRHTSARCWRSRCARARPGRRAQETNYALSQVQWQERHRVGAVYSLVAMVLVYSVLPLF